MINVADLYSDNFLINFESLDRVEANQQECETYEVLPGDIFFVRSSLKLEGVGSSAMLVDVLEPTVFDCHIVRIHPSNNYVVSDYLINFLNSMLLRQRLVALAGTTTMTTISQPELASLEVVLPLLPEQHTIATFLNKETSKINTLIANKERLIELLQEKRAALISHAVTKGLDPAVKMKDSGVKWLGEIPAHWEIVPVWALFKLGRGSVISNLEIQDHPGPYPVYSSQTEDEGVLGYINTYQFEGTYLTWTTDGANAGTVFYRQGKFNCTNVCGTLFPKERQNDLRFFRYALSCSTFRYVRQDINPKLMNGVMARIRVQVPSFSEQCIIASYLAQETARIDALISKIGEAVEKLKEYSAALISAAVSGKIDVRGEVENYSGSLSVWGRINKTNKIWG